MLKKKRFFLKSNTKLILIKRYARVSGPFNFVYLLDFLRLGLALAIVAIIIYNNNLQLQVTISITLKF